MRFSLLVSVLVHVLVLFSLFFVFKTVPDMKLPKKIYSVKILQPVLRKSDPPPVVQEEKKAEVEVKKPEPAKPKDKPKPKPEVKKEEPKPAAEEKPMEVSVDKDPTDLTSMQVDAPRFPFSYYLSAIERKVSNNWFSSQSGRGEGYSCVVYFRLEKDGRVGDIRVETSSGNEFFDRSAQRAIRASSPFPPLPKAFTEPWLGIHFTFIQKE
ncbi:MAG TPA: energy transducer TonB [Candidatus Krumholzibacterium sp.]|nr:energy transducer TonB [Candidatus Krumholzibacterium sp.]